MRKATLLAIAAAALACAGGRAQQPRAESGPNTPVQTQHAYEMKGVVESVGGGLLGLGESVTIRRENAPTVRLGVADGTRIVLDGRRAALSELREGDEVRAVFDFRDSSPVAIELEAKKK